MPKVTVDMNLCEYHGQCVFVAPKEFWFDEDDELRYAEDVPEDHRARVEKAAKACPQLAIKVE
ncbi:ferredoxin [Celeribacter halophilus]|uniref:ferredoxin n=1 Tax=Celeribacter halophilus TaxID=576117 RepID=UPI001C0936BF|nr:ferredoxin [Celeribacter halophilus]MBU2891375.1 ferredoxin [Celeribacter halophilus]MDO6512391.1 ferredoxin [Celeribacter halophilus]